MSRQISLLPSPGLFLKPAPCSYQLLTYIASTVGSYYTLLITPKLPVLHLSSLPARTIMTNHIHTLLGLKTQFYGVDQSILPSD